MKSATSSPGCLDSLCNEYGKQVFDFLITIVIENFRAYA